MKRNVLVCLLLISIVGMGQKRGAGTAAVSQVVALKPEAWAFRPGTVEFGDSAGQARMIIRDGRQFVVLKDVDFANGTIEFDDMPTDPSFALFCFRWKDSAENECFYFRTELARDPYDMAAVQYTPVVKGVMYWDALPHFQTFARFSKTPYNHVKIVFSGHQMRVWVNSMERPTLEVPRLEGDVTHGAIAFQGQHILSNLVLKPGQVEGLSPAEGADPIVFDPRYLRHWEMTEPDSVGENSFMARRLGIRGIPGEKGAWRPIDAERRGFVNLSRVFGGTKPFGVPRMMWLRTTIHSDAARSVALRLGFLDDVSVFINGGLVYVDKNYFGTPGMKTPRGRISIENATLSLPLKAGDNIVMIGVGNNFYSWGIIARLDELQGLNIER